MKRESATKEYGELVLALTARVIAARRLAHKIINLEWEGVDKEKKHTYMRLAGNTDISAQVNMVLAEAAETSLRDVLDAVDVPNTEWVEFRSGDMQIQLTRPGSQETERKKEKKNHNAVFHSHKDESQPALFELPFTFWSRQVEAYKRKKPLAPKSITFCDLLIETGLHGMVTGATLFKVTTAAEHPSLTITADLSHAEAVAQKLIDDRAPELAFLHTRLDNLTLAIKPATHAIPEPVEVEEVGRVVSTDDLPLPAPAQDNLQGSEEAKEVG